MLKIANWNLERVSPEEKRAVRIKAEISKIYADIWIFTETHKDIGPEDYNLGVRSEPDPKSQDGECWSSIWSSHPMSSLMDCISDKERCCAVKVIHPEYGDLIIYATVLPWVGSSWRGQPWQKGDAFISALEVYKNDWKKLQRFYPDAILIIAGDFNQSLVDWHYYGSNLIRLKLEQVMGECDMTIVTAEENDPVARDSKPYACIDHICVSSSRMKQVYSTKRWPDKDKPDKNISDHFGIIAEIECKF